MRLWLILLLIGLTSCGPRNLNDYRSEGREAVRALTNELRQVQNRQDLIHAGPAIKARYSRMVELMIAAREFYEANAQSSIPELTEEDREYSQELRLELDRVLRIEGADKLIAKYQEEALNRLHLFQSKLDKRKLLRDKV